MPALSSSHVAKITDRLGVMYKNLLDAVRTNNAIGAEGLLQDIISRTNDYDVEVGQGALLQAAQTIDAKFGTKNDFDGVYHYLSATYTELTRGRHAQGAFPFFIAASGSPYIFVGADERFDNIQLWLSRLNGSGALTIAASYWNGAWTALTLTDATSGATKSGKISYTCPTDWIADSLNDVDGVSTPSTVVSTDLYWVRIQITTGASDNLVLLAPPRYFELESDNFLFDANGLINALVTQLRSYTNPTTNVAYVDLDEFLEDNPTAVRVSADFADLYYYANGTALLAKNVFPDQEYTFGSYNIATSVLTQTGTYKLASASPNPTTTTVAAAAYSRGSLGQSNTVDFAGTDVKGAITSTLNGTITLRLSGYDHTGALQTWSSGLAGWTITINGTLTAGTEYTATSEKGDGSRLLVLTSVAKTGAATSGVVAVRTALDRTPAL
jgi:hypothetical protein